MEAGKKVRQDAKALRERGNAVAFNIEFDEPPVASPRVAAQKPSPKPSPKASSESSEAKGRGMSELQNVLPRKKGWGPPVSDISAAPTRAPGVSPGAQREVFQKQRDAELDEARTSGESDALSAEEIQGEQDVLSRIEASKQQKEAQRAQAKQVRTCVN